VRGQLDLFGDPDRDALETLAKSIPAHVRLGTSSWTFEGWKGIVYKQRYGSKQDFVRDSLAEYARWPLFRTVGIDRSYYAPLAHEELLAYAAQLPPDFRCCTKAWSEITTQVFPDQPRFGGRAGKLNPSFLAPDPFAAHVATPLIESFDDHLGPVIMELAPTPGRRADPIETVLAIERFLEDAPFGIHYAFELREPQLLTDRYLDVLRAHGSASHVLNLHTNMPPIGAQLDRGALMGRVAVARLMVMPGKRYAQMKEAYTPFDRLAAPQPSMRADVLRLIAETAARGIELYVIANNKVEGCSPLTVRAIVEELAARR
jgi:uncharacterized protein YecE (DUF72 family)